MAGEKKDEGKLPLHLLSAPALFDTAAVLRFGAKKYKDRNWEEGIAYSRVFAALQRHLWKWWSGYNTDDESGLPHLSHAACCLMFLQHYRALDRTDFDDRPYHQVGVQND